MKKVLLGILSLFLLVGTAQAQDGKKAFKNAKKALGSYNLDPSNNRADLQGAMDAIEEALNGSETKNSADTWLVRGNIYAAIAQEVVTIRTTNFGDEAELPKLDDPAKVAMESYLKVIELADKKYHAKDAIKGLQGVQGNLSQYGIYHYDAEKFENAYSAFSGAVQIHEKLKEAGEESSLDAEDNLQYQEYLCGLSALNGDMKDKAKMHFEKLYKEGYDKPAIFEALYKLNADADIDAAYKYLETGREKHPDDVSILFAEINHFLKIGKLEALIEKLKQALQKEPNNLSIYTTLGNVYDQLYQKAYDEQKQEDADKYFASAKDYYEQATNIDPKYFEAIYSVGALHYNKAAFMAKELNELGKDLSKEGMKKFDAKKIELIEEFDKALPFFQQAEKVNPNDANTLIALKEIYAKKNNFEMSNEFKARLETVQGGGKVESSYFQK